MNQVLISQPRFDNDRAALFQGNVAETLNQGAVAAMMSVGHRLGLFDALANLPPATSDDIAAAAGLAERYVREWLAVMVMADIVRYDPKARAYALPAEHAASLTRNAALGNLAVYAQFIGLFGAVQDRLLDAFRSGDGIDYGDYPRFHHFMAEDSQQTVVDGLLDILDALAPDLVTRLRQGLDVLDAGCGAGRALIRLAEHYPAGRYRGYDLCGEAVAMAETQAAQRGFTNVRFVVQDLMTFSASGAFDLITSFDAIHDTADPQALLTAIHRALKPGGVHLMQDIGGSATLENNRDFPFAAFLYAVSCAHCTPVSLAQGGAGLGTMWGWETAEAMLAAAGFDSVTRTVLPHDPMNVWFVSRKA